MEIPWKFIAFLLGIAFTILWTAFLISLDKDRITKELERKGWNVIFVKWRIFGKGWFGEKGDRIYRVRYKVNDEFVEKWCKTSLFRGVYFAED